jgi:hypothetical protein
MERQTDIEIYVQGCAEDRIVDWVRSNVGLLKTAYEGDGRTIYAGLIGLVVITRDVEDGPFTSVWFNTPHTRWATDVECGRAAAAQLGCVVRCSPGALYPEAGEDELLEIDGAGERLVAFH